MILISRYKTSIGLLISVFSFLPLEAYSETSWYGGVGYGYSDYTGGDYDDFSTRRGVYGENANARFNDSGPLNNFYLGLNVTSRVAVELGYTRLDDLMNRYEEDGRLLPDAINPPFSDRMHDTEAINAEGFSLSLISNYPISRGVSAFALAGYAYIKQERQLSGGRLDDPDRLNPAPSILIQNFKENEQGILLGVGAKVDLNDEFKARLQWTKEKPGSLDIESVRFSIEYHL